jgi:hypothetical protein
VRTKLAVRLERPAPVQFAGHACLLEGPDRNLSKTTDAMPRLWPRVTGKEGTWYVATGSWNDPAEAVDEARFRQLMLRLIAHLP